MATMKQAACMVLFCTMVVALAPYAQAITCGQAASAVAPCITYLKTGGPIPRNCCNGISSLNNAAKTTPDRQTACNCLKSVAKSIPGINFSNAASLPGKCGVNIPYKISPSINCATVK